MPSLSEEEFGKVLPSLLEKFKTSITFRTALQGQSAYGPLLQAVQDLTGMPANVRAFGTPYVSEKCNLSKDRVRTLFLKFRQLVDSYNEQEGKQEAVKFHAKPKEYIFAEGITPREERFDSDSDETANQPIDAREFVRLITALCEQRQLDESARLKLFENWVKDSKNPGSKAWTLARVVTDEARGAEAAQADSMRADAFKVRVEELLRAKLGPSLTQEEMASIFLDFPPGPARRRPSRGGFEDFVAKLEEIGMTVKDLDELAELFKVNSLLLQPLRSRPVRDSHLQLDFKTFIKSSSRKAGSVASATSEYFTPPYRLVDTDAAFVWAHLGPGEGGISDIHEHPGDEMIYVRSGCVEFHIEHSGVTTVLNTGDLIHFYAEYRHWIRNLDDKHPAELLVVRFYQLDIGKRSTRQALAVDIEKSLAANQRLSDDAALWVRQLLPPIQAGGDVFDDLGLARFLSDWDAANADIVRPEFNDDPANSLRTAACINDLDRIATARGIQPYLLRHYSVRALPSPIVIRSADYELVSTNDPRVQHRIPKRNLSCSDISIAKVHLDGIGFSGESGDTPHATTSFNKHPGYEAVFVTQGAIRLYYEGREECVAVASAQHNQLCHFKSSLNHRISNDSLEESAEYLVIRFYRDGR